MMEIMHLTRNCFVRHALPYGGASARAHATLHYVCYAGACLLLCTHASPPLQTSLRAISLGVRARVRMRHEHRACAHNRVSSERARAASGRPPELPCRNCPSGAEEGSNGGAYHPGTAIKYAICARARARVCKIVFVSRLSTSVASLCTRAV